LVRINEVSNKITQHYEINLICGCFIYLYDNASIKRGISITQIRNWLKEPNFMWMKSLAGYYKAKRGQRLQGFIYRQGFNVDWMGASDQ
jgi:hypothetical protein